jgi:hypothetical protein
MKAPSLLSSSEIDVEMERHIAASIRHIDASKRHTIATEELLAEVKKRKGTESIESKINRLTEMRRIFVKALLNSQEREMTTLDIEKIVWQTKEDEDVNPETRRKFVQRLEKAMAKLAIPLFIESLSENGEVYAYRIIQLGMKKDKI